MAIPEIGLLEYDVMCNGEANRFCAECRRLIDNV